MPVSMPKVRSTTSSSGDARRVKERGDESTWVGEGHPPALQLLVVVPIINAEGFVGTETGSALDRGQQQFRNILK